MYSNIDYLNIKKPFIAMYGGSFNPIHLGHTQLAEYFLDKLPLDKLLLIPDGKPPHKSDKAMISAEHRFNMCKLAVNNITNIEVSDIEIKRAGKSYTVDTLRQLELIYPNAQLFLIMGADMFLSLHSWKNYEEIFSRAIICAVPRENDDIDELIKYSKSMECYSIRTIISDKFMMNVSSTEIRNNIANSIPVTGMVGKEVEQYIYKNKLYLE